MPPTQFAESGSTETWRHSTGVPTNSSSFVGSGHFTQKERDGESGNEYFFARYYNAPTGRFLSPDWSAKIEPVPYAKMDDPQTLNLYAYVGNNPIIHVDVDGHMQCDGFWCNPSGSSSQQ